MLSFLLGAAMAPGINVNYTEFGGLQIDVNGVPLVVGSAFQYYEIGWKRGIYSSNWRPKTIRPMSNGRTEITFLGDDANVTGSIELSPLIDGVNVKYRFVWRGKGEIRMENSLGLVWAPAVEEGRLQLDTFTARSMTNRARDGADVKARMFGSGATQVDIDAPMANIQVTITRPNTLFFDARGHSPDWAKNRELFWLGHMDVPLFPNQPLEFEATWKIQPKPMQPAGAPKQVSASLEKTSMAVQAEKDALPLVPKPKERSFGSGYVQLAQEFDAPQEGLGGELWQQAEETIWQRWSRSSFNPATQKAKVTADVRNLNLRPEGYEVRVTAEGIQLLGQSETGLRRAFQTLPWLIEPLSGRLAIRHQTIRDEPALSWRGVHMFVGPTALDFQTRLMDRVLAPLKLNRVVLQCERTAWEATKGNETRITMPRDDLKALFGRYRDRGFEAIPLIQSLGHTGWLFENKQNLDIAVNPDLPFTLDPRKERSRTLLRSLWKEAVETLEPQTVHFGLDEIDMRGLPVDPYFTTRLWERHVPFLQDLSTELKVRPMLWGDIMLGPGEAPDAVHAKTVEEAKKRRSVLKPGAIIADWHYKDDADPQIYTSLALFKREGHRPVAASWWRPNNIRGQALASQKVDGGLLQTTWAGYESSEPNMIRELQQFSAHIVAADYAWSGRTEMPNALGYDPKKLLQRLYFSQPARAQGAGGAFMEPEGQRGRRTAFDDVSVSLIQPMQLFSPISEAGRSAPHQIIFPINQAASEIVVALDCLAWVPDNEVIGEVTLVLQSGERVTKPLIYGSHARAIHDARPAVLAARQGTVSAYRVPVPESAQVASVSIRAGDSAAGLRVHGLTVVDP